jgi:hypothetical protein
MIEVPSLSVSAKRIQYPLFDANFSNSKNLTQGFCRMQKAQTLAETLRNLPESSETGDSVEKHSKLYEKRDSKSKSFGSKPA